MPAGAVSLIGLLNPVVGTTLGVAVAGEAFGSPQAFGVVLVLGGVVAGQPGTLAWVRRAVAVRTQRTAEPCPTC
jgi:probable blue pigment (indigoidine) exporter